MKRLVLVAAVLLALVGCATPPPPPPMLISRPVVSGEPAHRRERTVTEVETVAPIYGGVPAEKAAGGR
jgi:hypothetical protein